MHIDRTEFGSITIDGTTYDHDVKVGLDGKVTKRKKKLSKQQYGTSHIISETEARSIFEKGCDLLIVGTGQEGNVRLSPEAEAYFEKKGCKVLLRPTQEAIGSFNAAKEPKIALIHVTC
jgi:hypothetical protein